MDMNVAISPADYRKIGRKLREARESQGHNLAILAGQCQLSVVQITAIERGDTLAFARAQNNPLQAIEAYSKALGLDLQSIHPLSNQVDDGIYIPEFLRKK